MAEMRSRDRDKHNTFVLIFFRRGFIGRGDLSGIAATVAMQAQQRRERLNSSEKLQSITHNLLTKPPPVVAPKPGRGSSDPPITTVIKLSFYKKKRCL